MITEKGGKNTKARPVIKLGQEGELHREKRGTQEHAMPLGKGQGGKTIDGTGGERGIPFLEKTPTRHASVQPEVVVGKKKTRTRQCHYRKRKKRSSPAL